MTRAQLQRLNNASLRQLARRIGLRGAEAHERGALVTGLAAYFERVPPEPTQDPDEPAPDPSGIGLPPALATPTMARLLEAQGKQREASALRAQLVASPASPPLPHQEAISLDASDPGRIVIRCHLPPPPIRPGHSADQAPPLILAVRCWAADGTQSEQRFTSHLDHVLFTPTAETVTLCAAVGVLTEGTFQPFARTALISLRPGTPPSGTPSDP